MAGMKGLLSLKIEDAASLYEAYMPFVDGGGLFIPTEKSYQLGDEVFLKLNLPEEPDTLPIAAKVIWITLKGAQSRRMAGIGIQFMDVRGVAKAKIETLLAGALESGRETRTM
ncbi:hypothetical protein CI610_01093 [invertebrate metagenome]|uniref:PilZ domain-containing protein n=1 Tax=invertebrate metagenome TaxID=1711999 RepID=A0A2H9T9Q1_9ZZZZ